MKKTFTNKLKKAAIGSLSIKLVNIALGFFVTIVLANVMTSYEFGIYSYVFSIASLMSIPARFGIQKLLLRETARGMALENRELVKGLWVWGGSCVIALSIFSCACYFLVFYFQSLDKQAIYYDTALIGAFLIPLMALASVRAGILQGLGYIVYAHIPEQLLRPLFFIIIVFIVTTFFLVDMSSEYVIFLHTSVWLFVFIIGVCFLWLKKPASIDKNLKAKYNCAVWLRAVIPLGLTGVMYQINTYADILILGYWVEPEEIGIYRIAIQLALLIALGMQVVEMFVSPMIAKLYAEGSIKRLRRLVAICSMVSFVMAGGIYILLNFVGEFVIEMFFGIDFIKAYTILLVLGFGQVVSSFFGSLGPLASMTGHEGLAAKCIMASAIINVLLNFLLIPFFGVMGAAAATAISVVVRNIYLWFSIFKKVKINSCAVSFFEG